MPEVEVQPTAAQVRRLLEAQLPRELRGLLDLTPTPVAQGWDNALFRLGPAHAPRGPGLAPQLHALRGHRRSAQRGLRLRLAWRQTPVLMTAPLRGPCLQGHRACVIVAFGLRAVCPGHIPSVRS